jgi:hypothetical protein
VGNKRHNEEATPNRPAGNHLFMELVVEKMRGTSMLGKIRNPNIEIRRKFEKLEKIKIRKGGAPA